MASFNFLLTAFLSFGAMAMCYGNDLPESLHAPGGQQVLAFPGAEGGGKFTTGGRAGQVIKVSNLNDHGPGSFREALQAKGSRTIVFDVSGTIELQSPLYVENGDLTVAGQSAPGDGVCLKGHEFRIAADNVIIRFLRFRPGDVAGEEYDAITCIGQKNIIIDHCSMSWSTDETASFYNNENFTLQWCIISESLNHSVHSKGAHGYGGIWGGRNASFHHNILAHHNSRNPRLQGARSHHDQEAEIAEIAHNIIYNWGDKAIYGGENGRYNIIWNIFIPGPATSKSARSEILEPYMPYGRFHLQGNIVEGSESITSDNWLGVNVPQTAFKETRSESAFLISKPLAYKETGMVYKVILQQAGASFFRDAVDHRIIRNIKERSFSFGKQGIINSQNQTGGWPLLRSLPPAVDTDGDGIPDYWELMNGLDPNNTADGSATSLDPPYTNLEVYLNDFNLTGD